VLFFLPVILHLTSSLFSERKVTSLISLEIVRLKSKHSVFHVCTTRFLHSEAIIRSCLSYSGPELCGICISGAPYSSPSILTVSKRFILLFGGIVLILLSLQKYRVDLNDSYYACANINLLPLPPSSHLEMASPYSISRPIKSSPLQHAQYYLYDCLIRHPRPSLQ
jgi:hypothetical protein